MLTSAHTQNTPWPDSIKTTLLKIQMCELFINIEVEVSIKNSNYRQTIDKQGHLTKGPFINDTTPREGVNNFAMTVHKRLKIVTRVKNSTKICVTSFMTSLKGCNVAKLSQFLLLHQLPKKIQLTSKKCSKVTQK